MNQWVSCIVAASFAGVFFYFSWFFHHMLKSQLKEGMQKYDLQRVFRSVAATGAALFFALFASLYALSLPIKHDPSVTTLTEKAQISQAQLNPSDVGLHQTAGSQTDVLLSVLGIVMMLVTVAVINLTRNAVEDMRYAREEIDQKYQSLCQENTWSDIQYKRLQLIHENRQEYSKYEYGDDSTRHFRGLLGDYYESASFDQIKKYLRFIEETYDVNRHGPMLQTEKEYIEDLFRYFSKFGKTSDDYKLSSLAKKVLKKFQSY